MKTFRNLEQTPWILAPGALADTNTASGNVPVATQKQPLIECASFAIDPKGQQFANAYFYKELGADAELSHFVYEVSFLFPTAADAAASQALELDLQQTISGVTFNWGLQFDFAEDEIRVWNRAIKQWLPTGDQCPRWPTEEWQRVKLTVSRYLGTVDYLLLNFNGNDLLLNKIEGTASVGEKPQINFAIQLDSNQKGDPYRVMIDAVNITAE